MRQGYVDVSFRRLPCVAHSLQLVVRKALRHESCCKTVTKARALVGVIRKSSVMMQKLEDKCGKSVIMDCVTRWNSTNAMIKRLIDLRGPINEVLNEAAQDSLLASEWNKLEEIVKFFDPFKQHTDILQKDTQALSNVIPCLMELELHLRQADHVSSLRRVSYI